MYIDNLKFAKSGQSIEGELDVGLVERIQEIEEYKGVIKFQLAGSVDNLNRPTLNLHIHGIITTLCQNCLQPMEIQLDNSSAITIFFTEEQLDQALFSEDEDQGAEDGVLVEQEFDVMNLVEDEVIVSLPYVSKHDACVGLSYHDDTANPFSVLKKII